MSRKTAEKTDKVVDYSKWNNIEEISQDPKVSIDTSGYKEQERVTIPRSPRPAAAEPPVLPGMENLLDVPSPNAPKGAAAVRHYQIGFGHKIIPKKNSKHKKSSTISHLDEYVFENSKKSNDNQNEPNPKTTTTETKTDDSAKNNSETNNKKKEKSGGFRVKVEDVDESLMNEASELLSFLMKENHHDYYKHNPHMYKANQTKKKLEELKKKINDNNDEKKDDLIRDFKIDFVLKMGGAFLTDKSKKHTLKNENLNIAAKTIKYAFDNGNKNMILIHGAGSFGHFEAKEYKLNYGLLPVNNSQNINSTQGFVLTRAAVSVLHSHLIAKLIENQLPVISISPNGLVTSTNGVINRSQFKPLIVTIKNALKHGMIPLIHGDLIFDDKIGCSILSGDILIENLASVFVPQRVIFWTNVNGIFDLSNLNKSKPKLIQQIEVNEYGKPMFENNNILKQLKNPQKYYKDNANQDKKKSSDENEKLSEYVDMDSTGGMYGKIEVCARCCAQGFDVVITKGGTNDAKLSLLGRYTPNSTMFVKAST